MNTDSQFPLFSFLLSLRCLPLGWCSSHPGQVLLLFLLILSRNTITKIPKGISCVSINQIKLITKINDHNGRREDGLIKVEWPQGFVEPHRILAAAGLWRAMGDSAENWNDLAFFSVAMVSMLSVAWRWGVKRATAPTWT